MSKIYFPYDDGCPIEYTETIRYGTNIRDERQDFYYLGKLYSNSWFGKLAIIVYAENIPDKDKGTDHKLQKGWGTVDGYCIVPSVKTYDEAIKILIEHKAIPADFLTNN